MKTLKENIDKYNEYLHKKYYLAALTKKACIFHYFYFYKKHMLNSSIITEGIKDEILQESKKELIKDYEQVKRIISIGDYWLFEEWALLILYRLDLEMLKDFYKYKGLDFPDIDLHGLCEEIKTQSQTKKNLKDFNSALRSMKKNSALPFIDIWFESDLWEDSSFK